MCRIYHAKAHPIASSSTSVFSCCCYPYLKQYHGSGSVLCDDTGANIAEISFITEHGNLPALVLKTESLIGGIAAIYIGGESFNGVESNNGTTEEEMCSNRVSRQLKEAIVMHNI